MRKLLSFLLVLASLASFGQRPNTKVDVGNTVPISITGAPAVSTLSATEFEERIISEGMPIQSVVNTFPSSYVFNGTMKPDSNGIAVDATCFFFSVRAPLANTIYIKSAEGWVSAPALVTITKGSQTSRIQVGTSGWSRNYSNVWIGPKEQFNASVSGLIQSTGKTGNKIVGFGSADVYALAADQNRTAKKAIYILGDSNTQATAILAGGTTAIASSTLTCEDIWDYKVKAWYVSRGFDVRIIDKSIASLGSVQYETYRQQGRLDLREAPYLIIYDHGTNDGNAATLASNVTTFCKWARAKWPANPATGYPGVKIEVNGQIPMQASAAEAQAALNRTAVQAAVTALNDPYVIYVNCGLAFSGSDQTQYSGTETAGLGIHMSATGQTSKANYIISQLNTNSLFKNL